MPARTDFDLIAYLVAAHHGKVRCSFQASPTDQVYEDRDGKGMPIHGVREGDQTPPVLDVGGAAFAPGATLTLEPAKLGLSPITGPSWTERVLGLVARYVLDGLGYMEAILRAADVRVSAGIPESQPKIEVKR
jgi:CRISPR-associated endonuclease/helicase Cas3